MAKIIKSNVRVLGENVQFKAHCFVCTSMKHEVFAIIFYQPPRETPSYNHNFHSNPLGLCILTCWHKLSLGCTPVHLMGEMGIKYWLVLTRQLAMILWIIFLLFHLNYPSSHDVYCKFKYLVNNPITLVYKYSIIQLILKIKRLGMHLICIIIP